MPKIPWPSFIDPFADGAPHLCRAAGGRAGGPGCVAAISRQTIAFGLLAAAFLVTGCQLGTYTPQIASLRADELRRSAEERKEEMIRQLAQCESGGVGPSDRPIHGGRGVYLGRLQFSMQTVIGYQMRKDGRRLSPQEAARLAHDYDRSAELAKYMIFDLEEPWHWPHCAKKISLRSEISTVKEVFNQAQAADAKAKADASIAMAEDETANPRAH
jgi:hypothetical protein